MTDDSQNPRPATILELLRDVDAARRADDPDRAEKAVRAFLSLWRRISPPPTGSDAAELIRKAIADGLPPEVELVRLMHLESQLRDDPALHREADGATMVRLWLTRQRGQAADQADLN